MDVSIGPRPDPLAASGRLHAVLERWPSIVVACSGGIDSLTLATVAHRASPGSTTVAHTVTPAVPGDGTARVIEYAEREGWHLEIVRSGEFDDENYLSNPTDRCYHCKSHLYDAIGRIAAAPTGPFADDDDDGATAPVIVSGANLDDLGEYRPGLTAAAERRVRHPYVDAEITKAEIRAIARHLGLADAELPASPCLASRLYTGTRVTASRLRAIEAGEAVVRRITGVEVVRCRVDGDIVRIEVGDADRCRIDATVLSSVERTMREVEPEIAAVRLDAERYRPGRAIVGRS